MTPHGWLLGLPLATAGLGLVVGLLLDWKERKAAIRAAVEEEREACAEIADGWDFGWKIAAAIRGRKG